MNEMVLQGPEAITSFYDMDMVAMGVADTGFTPQEEMRLLIRHVRDPDPSVSLNALKHFRKVMGDVLVRNGLVGNITQQVVEQVDDHTQKITSISARRLASRVAQEKQREADPSRRILVEGRPADDRVHSETQEPVDP